MAPVCCFLQHSSCVEREKSVPQIVIDEGYARFLAHEEVIIRDANKRGEFEEDCEESEHKEESDSKQSQDEYPWSSAPPCYTHLLPRDCLYSDGYQYRDGDKALLQGICEKSPSSSISDIRLICIIALGFGKPTVSAVRGHYFGPIPNFPSRPNTLTIPNVIPLPYGPNAPAFHLKAPDWDSLLKFLTRLRCTRLEPELEALACVEHQLRLRIVVAFAKVSTLSEVDVCLTWLLITPMYRFPKPLRYHSLKTLM